jgi:hypothetical protein
MPLAWRVPKSQSESGCPCVIWNGLFRQNVSGGEQRVLLEIVATASFDPSYDGLGREGSAAQLRIVTDELWSRVQTRFHSRLAGSHAASGESRNSTPR